MEDLENENCSEKVIKRVLKETILSESNKLIPVRGPLEYITGKYKYTFEVLGVLSSFIGIETIYKNNKVVYELKCCGGILN